MVTLKRFCAWANQVGLLMQDPARVVKLVGEAVQTPRYLNDQDEAKLMSAVNASGNLRDQAIIVLMLHTGLRATETCKVKREQVKLSKRSGSLSVLGKGNKYREVPLNATARAILEAYLPSIEQSDTTFLFASSKTKLALTERGLGYLVKRYAEIDRLEDVSPHDLRHRFGYPMASVVPLHRLAQIMGHNSLDTTLIYISATQKDLQAEVEKIAWS